MRRGICHNESSGASRVANALIGPKRADHRDLRVGDGTRLLQVGAGGVDACELGAIGRAQCERDRDRVLLVEPVRDASIESINRGRGPERGCAVLTQRASDPRAISVTAGAAQQE